MQPLYSPIDSTRTGQIDYVTDIEGNMQDSFALVDSLAEFLDQTSGSPKL